MEGDSNQLKFKGLGWPEQIRDVSAKLTVRHGVNPLYVSTENNEPCPVIDHEGSGSVYFNGIMSHYHSAYCLCESDMCEQQCGDVGPIVGFGHTDIEGTVRGNPNRKIEYYVAGSTQVKRPIFHLEHYLVKSFLITGVNKGHAYISMHGSDRETRAADSVVHEFNHITVRLGSTGFCMFSELILNDVDFMIDEGVAYIFEPNRLVTDFTSLAALNRSNLLRPYTRHVTIHGGAAVGGVVFLCQKYVQLDGINGRSVVLDISGMSDALTLKVTDATMENPFLMSVQVPDRHRVPSLVLDVSGSQPPNAFVRFSGSYRDLSGSVTIVHGPLNIHLDGTKPHSRRVPRVMLGGTGEFFVNGRKQIGNAKWKGGYRTQDVGTDWTSILIWGSLSALLICAVGLIWVFRPKRRHRNLPGQSFLSNFRDSRDDEVELTRYLRAEEDSLEVQ
jgi:hypothetical protein